MDFHFFCRGNLCNNWHQKRDLMGWAQPFMGFTKISDGQISDGQKKEKLKNENWNRKKGNKIYLSLCTLGWRELRYINWQLHVCGRHCILAHKCGLYIYIKSVHILHLPIQTGCFWWEMEGSSIRLAPQAPVLCPGWLVVSAQDSTAW